MDSRRALICGISGQDGSLLAKLLLDRGYAVSGTSRDAPLCAFTNLSRLGIRDRVSLESMSIVDFRSVLQTLAKVAPDEVYNLAGQTSVALSFEQPVETLESIATGTLNLLEAIRFVGKRIRFYNACSSECFGNVLDAPADETTPFRPRSPYALAKATAFWQVANYRDAYDLFACSGILFNHESPLRPHRFVTRKIVSAAARIARGSRELLILGDMTIRRDWGWAEEYVDAMWRMLRADVADDYVVATGETHSLEEFVAQAFAGVGLDWREHVKSDTSYTRPLELGVSRANPAKAARQLAWSAKLRMKDVVAKMTQFEVQASSALP
jgi:GDPmannose 4,6-dehydratase